MIKKINNNKMAIIVLHEIYGINTFIEGVCSAFHIQGFDVFCPDMLSRECFLYAQEPEAYHYFINEVGFDFYREIEKFIAQLKNTYDKVFVIGFSVGATIAWRCCEHNMLDGIICCYGSRIRDYLSLRPSCPALLLFAKQDSFDVDRVIKQLFGKPKVEIHKLKAKHGFMDQYCKYFNEEQTKISKEFIRDFLHSNCPIKMIDGRA